MSFERPIMRLLVDDLTYIGDFIANYYNHQVGRRV